MGQGKVIAGKWRHLYLNNNKNNIFSIRSICVVLQEAPLNNLILTVVIIFLIITSECILEKNHLVRRSKLFKFLDIYD